LTDEEKVKSKLEIRIGTSGYSFADWEGNFYPSGTPKGKMLDYYAKHFDTVEVNSTYYRIMHPTVSRNMVNKTPDDFEFFIKLHSSMTHSRDASKEQWNDFMQMLEPFREEDKLSGLLAQFPYSFKPTEDNLKYICSLPEMTDNIPLAVEFRYDGWYLTSKLESISGDGMALVSVDLPRLPHLPPPVGIGGNPFGYVRFHGRNKGKWWDGGALRYDYNYSTEELRAWVPTIEHIGRRSNKVYLMFNNCHMGNAARNALSMKELFGEDIQ